MSDDIETRPEDSNADAWHLFLSEYLDARANSPSGMTFMAVQIAEAIDDAERRGASSNLPCGHHISSLVKSVESDAQFCEVCDLMSQRDDAVAMEEQYRAERDSLRKALDDRYTADLKAAKAIFVETGRTSGFPSVKEVVAFYVAEVERLEKEGREARIAEHQTFMDAASINVENNSIRAKLERAKEVLGWYASNATPGQDMWRIVDKDGSPLIEFGFIGDRARAVLSELSADAPAQQTRDCTCHPSEAPVPCQHKYAFSECVKAAQQTQISDEVREALAKLRSVMK